MARQAPEPCDTTANRGWRDLTNGLLTEAAFGVGLPRDPDPRPTLRRVGEPRPGSLPELAVVVFTLPQAPRRHLPIRVQSMLGAAPIEPTAGSVIEWR